MVHFIPLSRRVTRPLSLLMVIAWIAVMAVLVNRSYVQATGNLATDLARYGSRPSGAACTTAARNWGSPSVRRYLSTTAREAAEGVSNCRRTVSCR